MNLINTYYKSTIARIRRAFNWYMKLRKYVHALERFVKAKIHDWALKALVFLLIIMAFFSIFGLIIIVLFLPATSVLAISNIGFAMLLALGNVCFSWGRSIDPEKKEDIISINECGKNSTLAAISFALGSVFKYLKNSYLSVAFDTDTLQYTIFKIALQISFVAAFLIACLLTLHVLARLFAVYSYSMSHNPFDPLKPKPDDLKKPNVKDYL